MRLQCDLVIQWGRALDLFERDLLIYLFDISIERHCTRKDPSQWLATLIPLDVYGDPDCQFIEDRINGQEWGPRYFRVQHAATYISQCTCKSTLVCVKRNSYWHRVVQDISKVSVKGLTGLTYVDKVQNGAKATESRDEVTVSSEVDRIYCDAPNKLQVNFGGSNVVDIEKFGLKDTGTLTKKKSDDHRGRLITHAPSCLESLDWQGKGYGWFWRWRVPQHDLRRGRLSCWLGQTRWWWDLDWWTSPQRIVERVCDSFNDAFSIKP